MNLRISLSKVLGGAAAVLLMTGLLVSVVQSDTIPVVVVTPNGSEMWSGIQDITWTVNSGSGNIDIALVTNTGGSDNTSVVIATVDRGVVGSTGTYNWDTTKLGIAGGDTTDGDNYRIRILDSVQSATFDTSDANFTIDNTAPDTAYSIVAGTPDGANGWYTTAPTVTLTCADATSGCDKIKYSLDNGASWTTVDVDGVTAATTINLTDGIHDIKYYSIDSAGNEETANEPATIVKVDTTAPTVTDGNITVSGGTDNGGVQMFIEGDTAILTWNNSTTGDNNLDIASVVATVDVSTITGTGIPTGLEALLGARNELMLDDGSSCGDIADDGIYSACYTIATPLTIELTSVFAIVTATDTAGNTGTATDTTSTELDTLLPIITEAGTITLTTDANTDGIASIGDTITYAIGTVDYTDGDMWTVDLSEYRLSATAGVGDHTIVADNDYGTFSATETVTDDAGNIVTGNVALSGFSNIDNIAPIVTDVNINVSGRAMIGGSQVFKNGDIAILTWDNSANGDNNPDIASVVATVNASAMTGTGTTEVTDGLKTLLGNQSRTMLDDGSSCGDIANDGIYSACYTIATPISIELTNVFAVVTAYDEAKNSGTDTDTTVTILDTLAPTAPTNLELLDPINSHNKNAVTITGTGEANASIAWSITDGTNTVTNTSPVTVDAGGVINISGIDVTNLTDGILTVTVTLTDRVGNVGNAGTDIATKDTVVAGVSTIETTDTETTPDGSIDTVTIVFDNEINIDTFIASDFAIGGTTATAVSVDNDNLTVTLTFGTQIEGTDAKTVVYTQDTAKDEAGNLITGFSIVATDKAGPVPISAKTVSATEIEVVFSEDLDGSSDGVGDFTVTNNSVDTTTENAGVVTITLNTAMNTGDTPDVTIVGGGATGLKDMNNNWSAAQYTLTSSDGVAAVVTGITVVNTTTTHNYAKAGDVVKITFTMSEPSNTAVPTVRIGTDNSAINATATANSNEWVATRTMDENDAQELITYEIIVIDGANNSTTVTDSSAILYDRTLPTVEAGNDKEVNAQTTTVATASDTGTNASGLNTYAWTETTGNVTFGTPNTLNTTVDASTDGTYTLTLTVTDNAGNANSDTMEFIWDTTNPIVSTSIPFNNTQGVSTDAGVAKVIFDDLGNIMLVDASKITLVNDSTGVSYKTAVAVDGNSKTLNIDYSLLVNETTYRINVRPGAVTDVAGNVLSTNFISYFTTSETPDTIAPDAPVISTNSVTVDANFYTIEGTIAQDENNGQRVVNLYNGLVLAGSAVVTASQTNWSIITPLTQGSVNEFTAKATDEVGNVSVSSNSVTITEAAPAAVIPTITLEGDSTVSAYTVSEATARFGSGLQFNTENATSITVNGTSLTVGSTITAVTQADAITLGLHVYNVVVTSSTGDTTNITISYIVTADFDDTAALAVTGISAVPNESGSLGHAIADNTWVNGWRWTYYITVPTSETQINMKFSDFVSGANTIAAANNIRFYTAQSSTNSNNTSAITITRADTYGSALITLDADLEPAVAGRQIEVTVEMRVPIGSAGVSYSGSYGVRSQQ